MKKKLLCALATAAMVVAFAPAAQAGPPTTSMTHGPDGDDLYVSNGKNAWRLDADTGQAWHTNLKQDRTNDISIREFLEVWYDANGLTPTTADLAASTTCFGAGSTGAVFADDFVTRYVSYDDGLVISFEAPDDIVDGRQQSGWAEYVIQGQNGPRDWGGGHVQIRAYHNSGGDSPSMPISGALQNTTTGEWETTWWIDWDHYMNTSLGSVTESSSTTNMLLNAWQAWGDGKTNCGTGDPVASPNTIRWTVDTADILY